MRIGTSNTETAAAEDPRAGVQGQLPGDGHQTAGAEICWPKNSESVTNAAFLACQSERR